MNRLLFFTALICVLIVTQENLVRAEEGWKLPNLNPFKSEEPVKQRPRTKQSAAKESTGWSWPSLNPWGADQAKQQTGRARKQEPSTWEKMSSGTKSAWNKTTQTLMPWRKPELAVVRPPTGTNRVGAAVRKPEAEVKKAGFSSWFQKEEELPSSPKTVTDFLSQPRPDF